MKITQARYAPTLEAERLVKTIWELCDEGWQKEDQRRISVIKHVRSITGLSLKDAKALVEVVCLGIDIEQTVLAGRDIGDGV